MSLGVKFLPVSFRPMRPLRTRALVDKLLDLLADRILEFGAGLVGPEVEMFSSESHTVLRGGGRGLIGSCNTS